MTHTDSESPPQAAVPVGVGLLRLAVAQAALQHIFETPGSMQWYVRKHKPLLVERGALLLHAGSWYIDAQRFDQAVREIAADAARAQIVRVA